MRGVKIYHLYVMFQLGEEVEGAEVRRQSSMVPFNLINSNDFAHPWSRNGVLMCFWSGEWNNNLLWRWTWFKIASQLQLFKILKYPSDRSFPPKKASCLRWISKLTPNFNVGTEPNPQKTLWSSRGRAGTSTTTAIAGNLHRPNRAPMRWFLLLSFVRVQFANFSAHPLDAGLGTNESALEWKIFVAEGLFYDERLDCLLCHAKFSTLLWSESTLQPYGCWQRTEWGMRWTILQ